MSSSSETGHILTFQRTQKVPMVFVFNEEKEKEAVYVEVHFIFLWLLYRGNQWRQSGRFDKITINALFLFV